MIFRLLLFLTENPFHTDGVLQEKTKYRYQLITGRIEKKPYATDVSALDRKEGNISPTMVQKWQEGVKLSTRKLMVVRTSYSGMRESVHNKTMDPVTSFSSHCPSYQYPIFTVYTSRFFRILQLAAQSKIKILLILRPFFQWIYKTNIFIKKKHLW